jgi:hypothetical protein
MTRQQIIEAIQRTAADNGGTPLGWRSFVKVTGIGESRWRGKYWRNWGEAVQEAGFEPNRPKEAHERDALILALTTLTAKLGRFPTQADVMLERRADATSPSMTAYDKYLGRRAEMVEAVRTLATEHEEYRPVLAVLPAAEATQSEVEVAADGVDGAVYMLKLGRHYKIGKSYRVPRRHQEIAIELPEKPEVVHVITTDDPSGIETYWHKRFADKHTNGEWFALTREDVRAFKRRRFM